jgi:hypothetical protein
LLHDITKAIAMMLMHFIRSCFLLMLMFDSWVRRPCCLYAGVCCCFVWYNADEHMSCHAKYTLLQFKTLWTCLENLHEPCWMLLFADRVLVLMLEISWSMPCCCYAWTQKTICFVLYPVGCLLLCMMKHDDDEYCCCIIHGSVQKFMWCVCLVVAKCCGLNTNAMLLYDFVWRLL